jgi:hypothetical protein
MKEVLDNLPNTISKAINPADIFNIDKWISITTDALSPIMEIEVKLMYDVVVPLGSFRRNT